MQYLIAEALAHGPFLPEFQTLPISLSVAAVAEVVHGRMVPIQVSVPEVVVQVESLQQVLSQQPEEPQSHLPLELAVVAVL
jgi:hypothetical protein